MSTKLCFHCREVKHATAFPAGKNYCTQCKYRLKVELEHRQQDGKSLISRLMASWKR